jgi:hypothetical protein
MREWRLVQEIALGAGTAGWIRTTDLLIHSFIVQISLSFLAFPVYAKPLLIGRFLPRTDSCSFLEFPLRWLRGGSLKGGQSRSGHAREANQQSDTSTRSHQLIESTSFGIATLRASDCACSRRAKSPMS